MIIDHNKKYGICGHDMGIGDAIIKSSFPENFYRNYNKKLIDIENKWIYDYNPYVIRGEQPDIIFNYLQDQISIIRENKRIPHLSFAEEYCWNYQLPKCWIRRPRLYRFEDSETQQDLVVIHTTGRTVGSISDEVINQIKNNYKNYRIIQIGSSSDKLTNFEKFLDLNLWDTAEIISQAAIYIGVNSGFYHVANCYPKVRKKIILNYCEEPHLKKLTPMNYEIGGEWLDFNIEYYNQYSIDIGITNSYNNI